MEAGVLLTLRLKRAFSRPDMVAVVGDVLVRDAGGFCMRR